MEEHPASDSVPFRKCSGNAIKSRLSPVSQLPQGKSGLFDHNAFERGFDASLNFVSDSVQVHKSEIGRRQNSGNQLRDLKGKGLLSIDISRNNETFHPGLISSRGNTPIGDRRGIIGRDSTCSDRCSTGGKILAKQPQLGDMTSKRKITVLKLPPLDGPMATHVNKPIVDHERLVRDTPKGNVTPATEFMAG